MRDFIMVSSSTRLKLYLVFRAVRRCGQLWRGWNSVLLSLYRSLFRHQLHLFPTTNLGMGHTFGTGTRLLIHKLRSALFADITISDFSLHFHVLLGFVRLVDACQALRRREKRISLFFHNRISSSKDLIHFIDPLHILLTSSPS